MTNDDEELDALKQRLLDSWRADCERTRYSTPGHTPVTQQLWWDYLDALWGIKDKVKA